MKKKQRFGKWQERLKRINKPLLLQLLAIFQTIILLTFFLNWPPVTLTLVVPAPEDKHWEALIADFHAQNPDIRIDLGKGSYTTDEVEAIYTAVFQTKKSPYDVVYMDLIWVPEFAKNKWLTDLSEQISKSELEQFLKTDVEAGRYQEGLYRIPFRSDAGVLYYRKDLLEQKGYQPPQTFAQLLQISQALQKQDGIRWGYVWQGQHYEGLVAMFVEVLQGYGGFWIDSTTREVGLDQPAALAAVKFLRDAIEQGISPSKVTTYAEEQSFDEFKQGNAVFLRSWPYIWSRVKEDEKNNNVRGKVGIAPMVHALGYSSSACKGGWGFGIAKNAKHPKEAWRAIKFFTSEAAQRKFVLELKSGYLPSRRSLFTDKDIVKQYPHFPALLKVTENSVLRPAIPEYHQASQILQDCLTSALSGKPIEEQMKAAAMETRNLLRLGSRSQGSGVCNT